MLLFENHSIALCFLTLFTTDTYLCTYLLPYQNSIILANYLGYYIILLVSKMVVYAYTMHTALLQYLFFIPLICCFLHLHAYA